MPVEGLPDPALHKRCHRCGEWFEEIDGRWLEKPQYGIGGAVIALVNRMIGDPKLIFICDGCNARGNRSALLMLGITVLVVLVGVALFYLLA